MLVSLSNPYPSEFWAYMIADRFNVTPGLHTQDLKYIFNDPQSPAFKPVAQDLLQTALTSFVTSGVPTVKDRSLGEFPRWDADGNVVSINGDEVCMAVNSVNETRCAWWQGLRSNKGAFL